MSIPLEEAAGQALAAREEAARPYEAIRDLAALEAMRSSSADDQQREILDHVILRRKRQVKGDFEALERIADLFDKAAVPLAAALPVFVSFLSAEHALVDPARFRWLLGSYTFGAVVWLFCRFASVRYGARARRGLAHLGKVE